MKALSKTANANAALTNYYNSPHNTKLVESIDLTTLLAMDIRFYYGIFVDFFTWYGMIIDVNDDGFSIYINKDHIDYNSPQAEWLYEQIEGNFYMEHKYTLKQNYKNPYLNKPAAITFNMYSAIVRGMELLNIDITNQNGLQKT